MRTCTWSTCTPPNSQEGLARIDYRMQWEDDLRAWLLALDAKKPVVYCGDLNVAHNEIDLKNPGPNQGSAGFSDQERAKMTQLLDAGFVDTFRFQHPDATGAYSWWSYRFNARKRTTRGGASTTSSSAAGWPPACRTRGSIRHFRFGPLPGGSDSGRQRIK